MTDLLKRSQAPILEEAWDAIDAEARRVLRLNLAGRKLVDFDGPYGWSFSAVSTGRLGIFSEQPAPEVSAGLREVQPLVELRSPIRLELMELDVVGRGADDPDLGAVIKAAERGARSEDSAIFHGYPAAGITGIIEASPHRPQIAGAAAEIPRAVAEAKEVLRGAGIGGPYALALGTAVYEEVSAATEDGYPILKRLERQLVDGPIVHAPAIEGGVLMSTRGNDYRLSVGQDWSIGYAYHERSAVELFITESFTFRVLEPAAAVPILRAR